MTSVDPSRATSPDRRRLLPAGAAVLLAAADTYVVVIALPAIMGGTRLGLDQLQKATPIVTGFLLGYVALLPLLGRLSDQHGRRPVFVGCLITFACGSAVTASAHSVSVVIAGRAIQGAGGGGLVPVTLALVAELWPPDERGLPLGVVGAVQELGSVLGPLYGAVVVAISGWRTIFWINLPVAGILAVAFAVGGGKRAGAGRGAGAAAGGGGADLAVGRGRPDVVGAGLAAIGGAAVVLALWAPPALAGSVSLGALYTPAVGGTTWAAFTSPMAFAAVGVLGALVVWEAWAPFGVRPLVAVRRLPAVLGDVDLPGALLLAAILACVVVVFSTTDPAKQVLASSAPVVLPLAAIATAVLVAHERHSSRPLIDAGVLRPRPAWGAMIVNLAVGAALMAALVDVPFFARSTVDPTSQLGAAAVLIRFLLAVPAGAVIGGFICRRRSDAGTAGAGMALAALAFVPMASWGAHTLATPLRLGATSLGVGASDVELVACGLGFGIAIAPINAAVLRAVRPESHGVASALTVVSRMVGMLVGLSALTAVGLRTFYRDQAKIGSALTLCPAHPTVCPAYDLGAEKAVLAELHTIFAGAAIAALVAAGLALLTLRRVRPASSH
ncbi:MAG TPA: MFS transporter [Acidimicrobiales bacterium]|nr:MFS transporter [Acidimicrobiales bacterium]